MIHRLEERQPTMALKLREKLVIAKDARFTHNLREPCKGQLPQDILAHSFKGDLCIDRKIDDLTVGQGVVYARTALIARLKLGTWA